MKIILALFMAILLAKATEDVKQDSTVVLELLWTLNQRTFYSLQSLDNSYIRSD